MADELNEVLRSSCWNLSYDVTKVELFCHNGAGQCRLEAGANGCSVLGTHLIGEINTLWDAF